MRRAVPALVGSRIPQAKIGGQVDDMRRQPGKLLDFVLRLAMGQGQEKHVGCFHLVGVDKLERRLFAQVGVHLVDILAQVAPRGDLRHLDLRMLDQQAQQLAAGVA